MENKIKYVQLSSDNKEKCADGADKMYLTADPVTGRPFWEAMGFLATGELSPENKMEIYEKSASFDWSVQY